MIFDGRNGGTVELLDNVLIIRRKGVTSFLTQGLKGEKRVPYSSITSVQFKEAGFTTGYIQFGIAGGIESRRGVWDATTDENTVLFTKEASAEFRRLRDLVEERAQSSRNGPNIATPTLAQGSVAEELSRLADLRDRGALTDEEFAEQKSRLLDARSRSPASGGPVRDNGSAPQQILSQAGEKKGGLGKTLGIGCLALLGLLIVLSAIGNSVKDRPATSTQSLGEESQSASASSEEEPTDAGVTMAGFEQLQTGMSYSEAVAILGGPGKEISRSDLGGTSTVMYQWEAGGFSVGNMNAMFQNGRLVSKAQFGLR